VKESTVRFETSIRNHRRLGSQGTPRGYDDGVGAAQGRRRVVVTRSAVRPSVQAGRRPQDASERRRGSGFGSPAQQATAVTGRPGEPEHDPYDSQPGSLATRPQARPLERQDSSGSGRNNNQLGRLAGVTLRCGFCEEPQALVLALVEWAPRDPTLVALRLTPALGLHWRIAGGMQNGDVLQAG
jgi:hypothetical protein